MCSQSFTQHLDAYQIQKIFFYQDRRHYLRNYMTVDQSQNSNFALAFKPNRLYVDGKKSVFFVLQSAGFVCQLKLLNLMKRGKIDLPNIINFMREDNPQNHAKPRQFTSNRPNAANPPFPGNQIKSTTTSPLTFIPVNLFNQIKSMANIYFIIIAILQMIPSISVTGGTPTVLVPLAFVMLAVLIKDAYEEYERYQKDKRENQRTIEVLGSNNRYDLDKWQSLQVGQIIKIKKQTLIPCDCIVIRTSDAENKCFVQTKSLDGETNFKYKTSFLNNLSGNRAASALLKEKDLQTQPFIINCGTPAPQINQFQGTIELKELKIPLDPTNLLLRGCILKNVHEAIAVCCYTGSDTKLVLNSAKFEPKKSKLMSEVDKIIIQVFIYQIIMAMVCALFNLLLESSYKQFTQYITSSNYWITSMTWWLLMTYFIPISLMVTMEMVKLFQGSVLSRDKQGYSQNYHCFTEANNTSVNENLGQIKFVFTDKTGTLTKNNMVFKHLVCNGQLFGELPAKDQDKNQNLVAPKRESVPKSHKSQKFVQSVNFRDSNFQKKRHQPKFQDALKVVSLCHEVSVEHEGEDTHYNSSSPDEVALINFAKLQGKEYLGEENKVIKVVDYQVGGMSKISEYQKLAVLQFNSDRKRMSVIVRDMATRKIQLLTKGADSTVKPLLRPGQDDLPATQKHIDYLSVLGLRTLFLGKKTISESQFQNWYKQLNEARGVIGQEKKHRINACYEKLEQNLELVGATAIEDELQDQVQETIRQMRLHGITFFILTGDKRQTAISIGRSCGLVDQNMKIIDIEQYDKDRDAEWRLQMLKHKQSKQEKIFLLNAEKTIPPDLPLHSTICYRCTPKNKEEVVRRIKSKTPYLTMAVGDGSNDVNMIKQASVGVGLKGVEGTQAARVADYVAGEFKFIKLLTLYYGREWYRKNCQLVNYSFFKNWFHVGCVIFYGGFSYFSGVVLFNVYLYELLNVVYAGWPIIIYALFDQQYTHKQSYKYTDIYQPGVNNQHFSHSAFLKTIGLGLLYGLITLLVVFEVLQEEVLDSTGKTGYLHLSGAVLFGVIIMIINMKILTMSTGVRPLTLIIVSLSVILYWISQALYGSLSSPADLLILKQQWMYSPVIFVQIILIFFLVFVEFGYRKYLQFEDRLRRANLEKTQYFVGGILQMNKILLDRK